MQVAQAVNQYKATLSPETPASHRDILTKFAKWCWDDEFEHLIAGSVYHFVFGIAPRLPFQPYPTRLMYHHAQIVKDFFMWCAKEGLVPEEMPNDLEMPEIDDVDVVEVLTRDQVRRLFATCKQEVNHRQAARDRAILAVLLDTGISGRELCDLKVENVVLTSENIRIKILGRGGHNTREVELGRRSKAAVDEYLMACRRKAPQTEQHFFLSMQWTPLTVEELTQILHRLRDESQIEGVQCNPETFKQTFAVQFMKSGGHIIRLNHLMGHTTDRKTENYLQAFNKKDVRINDSSILDGLIG